MWNTITVYPKKYAHGFVVLCFVVVMQSFIMNSHEAFIHIHQGCFAGTGTIVRLPQCQWSKPDGYGKISQCITTTKHSKAKTVCILLGIYCKWQKEYSIWSATFLLKFKQFLYRFSIKSYTPDGWVITSSIAVDKRLSATDAGFNLPNSPPPVCSAPLFTKNTPPYWYLLNMVPNANADGHLSRDMAWVITCSKRGLLATPL